MINVAALEGLQPSEDSFLEIQTALDKLTAELETYEEGTEGLSDMFAKVYSFFVRIFNNFKTIVTQFYKTVKRSELKFYHESNRLTVKKLQKLKFTEVTSVQVPVPMGMTMSYPDTIIKLDGAFQTMDMGTRSNQALSAVKDIHDNMLSSTPDLGRQITNANRTFDGTVAGKIKKEMGKLSNPHKKEMEVTFISQFKSMQAFFECNDMLTNLDTQYDLMDTVVDRLNSIQDFMDNILDHEDLLRGLSKGDIKSFADLAYRYAEVFDIYGQMMHLFHRVEHNFVACMKSLATAKNI